MIKDSLRKFKLAYEDTDTTWEDRRVATSFNRGIRNVCDSARIFIPWILKVATDAWNITRRSE